MAISKITLNGVTQMDLTNDSVVEETLQEGETATKANGERATGTMANPLNVSLYTTVSDIFNNPHAQVSNYATVEMTKNNKACTLYLYMAAARWTAMGSGTVLGTLKDDFVPAGKSGTTAYIIVPLLGSASPYVPCGSAWIYTQGTNRGKLIAYFDSSASPGYFFAPYISGAQN